MHVKMFAATGIWMGLTFSTPQRLTVTVSAGLFHPLRLKVMDRAACYPFWWDLTHCLHLICDQSRCECCNAAFVLQIGYSFHRAGVQSCCSQLLAVLRLRACSPAGRHGLLPVMWSHQRVSCFQWNLDQAQGSPKGCPKVQANSSVLSVFN